MQCYSSYVLTLRSKSRGPGESVDRYTELFKFAPLQVSNGFRPPACVYLYPLFFQRQLPVLALHSNPSPVSCIQYIQQSTVSFESKDWVANSIVKRVTSWTTRMIGVENARVTSHLFSFLFWTERAIGVERKKGKGAPSTLHIHNCQYKHRLWFNGVSDGKAPDAPPTCAKLKTGQ